MTAVRFEQDYDLTHLSREQLAMLGREYMLYGFHVTRVGLGYVHLGFGGDRCVRRKHQLGRTQSSQRLGEPASGNRFEKELAGGEVDGGDAGR